MEQIALYRKYRPHNFDNLVGQDHIRTTLVNAIKAGNVSHAYLFSGPRGTGKTSTARLLAKALNCSNPQNDYEPCGECEFCKDIIDGKLIDLIEIDAASNRGIDEVRDLNEKIRFSPTRSKYKVYIIDEVHMMTKEAFNALLKTLEEPPTHTYFILATTEVHKIPETIISRCQRFDFKRISNKAIMTRLSYIAQLENIKTDDKALELISRYVDGGLRDAIGLMEQLTREHELKLEYVQDILGVSSFTLLSELLEVLKNNDSKEALKIINTLHTQGSDLKQFTHEFLVLLREKLLEYVSRDELENISKFIWMLNIFEEAYLKINSSSIPQLPLEIAAIKITENFEDNSGNIKNIILSEKKEKIAEKEKSSNVSDISNRKHSSLSASEPIPNILFTFETVKENWPRITERIKSPALKMSLLHANPVKIDGATLLIEFSTNFHKDKVMEHAYKVELEEVIKNFFNHPVKIEATLKPLEIKSVVEENTSVDEALEIFGGELME